LDGNVEIKNRRRSDVDKIGAGGLSIGPVRDLGF
jgi:hypothetical protein